MTNPGNYHAYLLRLWRESERDPWRASLEDPHTGKRVAFAEVGPLLAYLSGQFGSDDPAAPNADRSAQAGSG